MTPDTRRKAALWLVLVFVLAASMGALLGYSFAHRSYASSVPPALSEPVRRARRVAEMTDKIGLTPDQAGKVDGVIRQAHESMKALHEKFDSDVENVRLNARKEIRTILTPEQLPKYEAYVKKMDEERKKGGQPAYGR
jgi:Spy/CpxP family protein refolding chaperone